MEKYRILISVFAFFLFSSTVFACSCAMSETVGDEFLVATAVFTGKVIEIKETAVQNYIKFSIIKAFKGLREKSVIVVETPKGQAVCGYDFEKNKEYLVYASGYKSKNKKVRLNTSTCSRTKKLSFALGDLRELERIAAPEYME